MATPVWMAKTLCLVPAELGVRAHVAAQIDHVNVAKLVGHHLAKAVKRAALDKGAIGDEGNNAVVAQPVAGPAVEAGVHVVELRFLRGAVLDVGVFDALVDCRVFAVLVVVRSR